LLTRHGRSRLRNTARIISEWRATDSIFYNMKRGVVNGYENMQNVWERAGE